MSRVQKNNGQKQQTTQNSEPTKRQPTKRQPTIAPVKRKDFRRLTKSPILKHKKN
ncbi:hypothetical protein [Peribacillus frigoritolerans]|uniref:hypothetical protein n=1 Tax=Peribacillus frigoritolerans TaxID=450367 RepID=UPI0022812FE9|nr:hypothetical protein [Peribacillus frigoritolerans]MCY8937868.1 hypothetical protein [Peribacillus frigoritolerans]